MISGKPLFITFEGIDGCGKSTQIELFTKWLQEENVDFILTREPGGCPISEKIRELVLSTKSELGSTGELLLYLAARAEHVEQLINPSIEKGSWVISDRFYDATYAYQGYGRQLGVETIKPLNEAAIGSTHPDYTILLDIDVDIAYTRRTGRGEADRLEQSGRDFFQRTRDGYLALAKEEPCRYIVVDASQDIDSVTLQILTAFKERLYVK